MTNSKKRTGKQRKTSGFNKKRIRTHRQTHKRLRTKSEKKRFFKNILKHGGMSWRTKRVSKKRSKNIKKSIKKIATIFAGLTFFTFVTGLIMLGIFLKQIGQHLPEPGKLLDRSSDKTSIIYDKNHKELYKIYGNQNRTYVKLEDYPPELIIAVLAAEDSEFYNHKGIDWVGMIRCTYLSAQNYLTHGKSGQLCGASTLSQQLTRNTLMYDAFGDEAFERSTLLGTVRRKIREILLTIQVEQSLTKDELLERYLNEVALGGVNYGFQAGAESIFGKDVDDLTLAESSLLAGLLSSPGAYNPIHGSNPEMAEIRKNYVLDQIWKHRAVWETHLNVKITKEDIAEAREEKLVFKPARIDIKAPHFVFYVKKQLIDMYGIDRVEKGGLRVTTTLDYKTQKIAEEELKNGIKKLGKPWGINNGALVAVVPRNGHIVAMVGSVDYWETDNPKIDGNVNAATSIRQMGSAMKPLVYLTAFHQGYGPWMPAPDIKEFDFNYNVHDWDYKWKGTMTARKALTTSRNIGAIDTAQIVGVNPILETAEKLGITTLTNRNKYGLSIAIGAGGEKLIEHLGAFAVFANQGIKKDMVSILKVETSDGKVLYEWKDTPGKRVFDAREVYLLNWTICDAGGFGDQLVSRHYMDHGKRIACGKGGTTNGPRDLTGFLYHKNLAVGVWAGNNDNSAAPGASSSLTTVPIAGSFLRKVQADYPSQLYSRPSGIASVTVCSDTGTIPENDTICPKENSVYIIGRGPQKDKRETIQVCKSNGLIPSNPGLASNYGLLEDKILMNYTFINPEQVGAFQKYMMSANGNMIFEKPKVGECNYPFGPNGEPIIEIISPENGSTVDAGTNVSIKATALAENDIQSVQFQFDGVDIVNGLDTEAPYQLTYTIPTAISSGGHQIAAIVTDSENKTNTTSVSINVNSSTPAVIIDLISPTNNAILHQADFPITLTCNVTGNVQSITFSVSQTVGGTYSKTFTDNNGTDGWNITWPFTSEITNGTYQIKALAINEGAESSINTIKIE